MTHEQVPVVGGPLDGKTLRWSTARFMQVPDCADMVSGVRNGEPYTLFGQHTYEMKCYARPDGEVMYRWEHVEYRKPEVK